VLRASRHVLATKRDIQVPHGGEFEPLQCNSVKALVEGRPLMVGGQSLLSRLELEQP